MLAYEGTPDIVIILSVCAGEVRKRLIILDIGDTAHKNEKVYFKIIQL